MVDLTTYLTAAVGFLGIIIGTLISPRVNHKIGIEYGRRDLIFKKKLEYFERVIDTIDKNKKMYNDSICKLENVRNKKEIGRVMEEIKKNRKNFSRMASPLYFDTRNLSERVIHFVKIEKDIFNLMSELKDDLSKQEEIIEKLKGNWKKLYKQGNDILFEMKKEILR